MEWIKLLNKAIAMKYGYETPEGFAKDNINLLGYRGRYMICTITLSNQQLTSNLEKYENVYKPKV